MTTGAAVLSALWLLTAFVLVALGVFVNPRFRRRLNRRHGRSEFGRGVDRGLVRRYREEYAVAGVPVYTRSEGYNHYCLECATDELGLAGASDASDQREEAALVDGERDLLLERDGDR